MSTESGPEQAASAASESPQKKKQKVNDSDEMKQDKEIVNYFLKHSDFLDMIAGQEWDLVYKMGQNSKESVLDPRWAKMKKDGIVKSKEHNYPAPDDADRVIADKKPTVATAKPDVRCNVDANKPAKKSPKLSRELQEISPLRRHWSFFKINSRRQSSEPIVVNNMKLWAH